MSLAIGERLRALATRPGCGPDCSDRFGHDAQTHEDFGRAQAEAARQRAVVRTGPLLIDMLRCRVDVNGIALTTLSPNEWGLLAALSAQCGDVVRFDDLVREVWGADYLLVSRRVLGHAVRCAVMRLRLRLGAAGSMVETVRGIGYRLREVQR